MENNTIQDVHENDSRVIFRGDGEPISPSLMARRLADGELGLRMNQDSYSQGGTVEELENRFAETLGKESAVFMPTGTLANHLAIRALCGGKPRAVVQEQSHLYNDTGDCVTHLSGINLIPIAPGRTCFMLEELKAAVNASESGRVANPIGAVMIESPVRRQMERVVPIEEMTVITDYCRALGIGTHLDGARLYMMSAATGVGIQEYSSLFDTVYVSLYKYFGAPFGAILAGESSLIDGMFHTRRMFGGGLAQAYFVAALALQGLDGFEERFHAALKKGRELFGILNQMPGIEIKELEHGSNVFPLVFAPGVDVGNVIAVLDRCGICLYPDQESGAYSRLTVNTTILRQSNDTICRAFEDALAAG